MPDILLRLLFSAVLVISSVHTAAAGSVGYDPQLLMQMQETIRQQQEQLKLQAEQIRQQSQKLELLQQQINAMQHPPTSSTGTTASAAPSAPQPASILAPLLPLSISSGNDKLKVSISGQVNRALNTVNDGKSTELYHVDNAASGSRLRLVGRAGMNSDLTLGTRAEFGITPDTSSRVSQSSQAPGDIFTQRWLEISLLSGTYGKLSVGKGDTASKGTAIQDLSKTEVVQFATISTVAGGMLFRNADAAHALTSIRVSDAFRSRDGLGRQSRLRYDTPSLFGFTLAGSLVTSQRSDLALLWGGEGYGLRGVAAAAVANPRLSGSGMLFDGSFSLLHTASGLNLTVSAAIQKRNPQKDATNLYTKLGWIANFTDVGHTAFGVDYTGSDNMPTSDDRGYSVGGAVVQSFDKYATDLYMQYRVYALERKTGSPLADMNVSTIGARVKF